MIIFFNSGFWKYSQAFWCVSNYHVIDIQMSPKARPVSSLSTAKEASSFITQVQLCYCFWNHHIGQKISFRLNKHWVVFCISHISLQNMLLQTNILNFFFIKSNSKTQQNHEPGSKQPIPSTALNRIHHLNFLFFISKSLQLLHVSPQSFKAEVGFYQAVTKSIVLHSKFLDFAICRVLVCRWVRW